MPRPEIKQVGVLYYITRPGLDDGWNLTQYLGEDLNWTEIPAKKNYMTTIVEAEERLQKWLDREETPEFQPKPVDLIEGANKQIEELRRTVHELRNMLAPLRTDVARYKWACEIIVRGCDKNNPAVVVAKKALGL